jgi:hypothetical protein
MPTLDIGQKFTNLTKTLTNDSKMEEKRNDDISKLKEFDEKLKETDDQDAFLFSSNIVQKVVGPFKDTDKLNEYMVELSEGKHLNDVQMGDLICFNSSEIHRIKKFLTKMKVEENSELFLQKSVCRRYRNQTIRFS